MSIEAVAASAIAKEVAGSTAIEAAAQLADKMGVNPANEISHLQPEQMYMHDDVKVGELNAPECENADVYEAREKEAAEELKNKLEENPDITEPHMESAEKIRENADKYPSSYMERIQQTPKDGELGYWTGERGESVFIPKDPAMKEFLARYGREGIEYKNGIPDFSFCSECDAEIDYMSPDRDRNFSQADIKCAEQWNAEAKFGKSDWTPRDVAQWRRENGYSWHECNDRKTCQLVPTDVNGYFGHLGGVAECKRANINKGDIFDV